MIAQWWRWLCVIFLSLNLLIISGCQTFPNASVSGEAKQVIHLTLWHGINPPPNRDVFQKLVDKFNKTHPNIQVESLYVGQADQQLAKILTAVVGNAPPDILWFSPMLTGQLLELGAIRPVEDWLNQSPLQSDIDPVMFESMNLDSHTWSIPMGTNNLGVFYRPSLFKAAGITQLPRTWEEFRQVARKLTQDKNGDGRPDQHGIILSLGKGEWTVFTWLPFMYSAGGELLQGDQPNLVNKGAISALQLWSDMVKEGSAILSAPERGYEQDDFIAGRVAMQLTGPWTLGYLPQAGIDFDVMPVPVLEKPAAVMGGENLFVMKTLPAREQAAWEFLQYVLTEEFQTQWALGTGYLPINLKARKSKAYQAFITQQPTLKVFLEQMKWTRSRPIIPGYSRLSDSLGRAIEATLLGGAPKEALENSQKRLNLILN
ncbi:ABC transporter substrate-binding protein [Microcoleus sp. FACHB-68]|uniref:ABC transporter substrate-binding protein n=1 Tax=Microcoleus sp. FACHB-68 TaxID=2692826 RepID=UPI001682EDC1|nr:ABC transporter substrate-binding protein [Microcoleus sp. FACHB-68]MBD1939695.1 ABC transporter substrate-binding protein [Microcoleus sp. FACHB-68]